MNVIISNQLSGIVNSLDIEVIKSIQGEYDVDDIISNFSNFFFNRMVIDVTALKDYDDIVTYQKLSIGLAVDKIILLIPTGSSIAKKSFLSKLISMGYYNFTTNSDGIYYLMEHPNSYKDVAHLHQLNTNDENTSNVKKNNIFNMNHNNSNSNSNYNNNNNYNYNNNNYNNNYIQYDSNIDNLMLGESFVLGIKNITSNAGASTLCYMIHKELEHRRISSCCIEINKRDFSLFNDDDMVSCNSSNFIHELSNYKKNDVIIVDLNDCEVDCCNEILYLVEPSIIKMNKLIRADRMVFSRLKNRKIILNKCVLSKSDIKEFQHEIGTELFYVIEPFDDRQRQDCISKLISSLGLVNK